MKTIIRGLRYDTDKATLIGESSANVSRRDFSYWEAGLYVTPRAKRYFLAGRGGPMTRWAHQVERNGYSGSSGIVPLDRAEALAWAEEHLPTEAVEAHFGADVQDA